MKQEIIAPGGQSLALAPEENPRPYLALGLLLVLLLVGGLGAWALSARLNGAVIATGKLAVQSSHKTVQHLEGGIVGEIFVKEGDLVERGQLLVRLDDTLDRAGHGILTGQLDELQARAARLTAERDGAAEIAFPEPLLARAAEPTVAKSLRGEQALFAARRATRDGAAKLLKQRIARFEEEIAGLAAQARSKKRQIDLLEKELAGLRKLYEKGYAPITRILALERQAEALAGERAAHRADIARARNGIGETELQLAQAENDHREAVTSELRTLEAEIFGLIERKAAVEARLARVEIRAAESGRVLNMTAKTVGGVIRAGDPILDIVPQGEELVVEAQIPVADIDKVARGLPSVVRLSALDQANTPEVAGIVESVSADRVLDERSNQPHFLARIRLSAAESRLGDGLDLVPGMPAEVFIQTGERQALSYFLKPLTDRLARSFKEG